MMRASVIVPAYNVAPYLSRCIESLLVQTERSIEILIIDDGSTDGITPELVDSLARGDSRVRAIHRANGGLSAARNAGLDAAAGEFVCFVDGDDWAEPNMVESMITACELEATPVAIAGAYVDFHDQDERLVRSERRILPRYVIDRSGSLDAALVDDNFINLVGYAWNKLYHRNWLLQTGAVFEGGLSLIEDIEFNARVLTVADRVVLVPDAFIHYVQRPRRTLGTTFDETYLAKRQRSLLAVDSLLTTWGVDKQARARRRVGASGLAMWGALQIAAETPHPVTTLRMMLEHPAAESIFSYSGSPAGWRGRWASGTLRRGWHRTALTPLLARGHLKWLRERPPLKFLRMGVGSGRTEAAGGRSMKRRREGLGGSVIGEIKRMVPERYKGPVLAQLSPASYPDLEPWRDRKKVVIALAGFYQNLGDMALTYAQKRFIETTLPDYDVLLFPASHTYSRMRALKRIVRPDDIITTIAGGNMDDVYPSLENARRYVVRSFPKHPIISFPQTFAFTDTPGGKRALRRSARTYRAHRRLTVFGREPQSLELMKAGLRGTRVEGCPDVVLSLGEEQAYTGRSGIMLTVRDDKEMLLTSGERQGIQRIIESKTDDILVRDTVDVALSGCQPNTFENSLRDFWDLLRSRRVVVTDRLHCMIFCVNTKTPVVVLPNSNHKIKGTYDAWLSGHSYVRYLDSFSPEALSAAIDELWELKPNQIHGPDLGAHYEPLRRALLDAAGRAE